MKYVYAGFTSRVFKNKQRLMRSLIPLKNGQIIYFLDDNFKYKIGDIIEVNQDEGFRTLTDLEQKVSKSIEIRYQLVSQYEKERFFEHKYMRKIKEQEDKIKNISIKDIQEHKIKHPKLTNYILKYINSRL